MGVRSQTRNSSRLLLHAVAASGRADIAASIAKSRPEQQSWEADEYCDEIFAEIRVA